MIVRSSFLARSFALVLALGLALPASAGPGHDGGHDDEAPALATDPAKPRFEAQSDMFEVVGILHGDELVLTLDDYATNAPVAGARIELESTEFSAVGEFRAERGDYRFAAAPLNRPGTHPITLTVAAGEEMDLLAADLVVSEPPHDEAHAHSLAERLLLGAGGVLVIAALGFGVMLVRRRQSPPAR